MSSSTSPHHFKEVPLSLMEFDLRQRSHLPSTPPSPTISRRPSSSMPRAPSSASTPYPRRTPGQPKSTRQQFSACGACRMRRVRCDLKDSCPVPSASSSQQPSCSNCRERNIRCVDEFAEVKAVKLLRRGRRLQQVEARYGKVTDDIQPVLQAPTSPTLPMSTIGSSCIPQLQLPFLNSSFFRRFCVQRPVIEPGEFASRYVAHLEGTTPLDIEGDMIAMLLVTWAASFGIDEFGHEDTENGPPESRSNPPFILDAGDNTFNPKQRARLLRTEAMTREILSLVDLHGLLRRPTWDGVRVLLLLLPLTHGIQTPMERRTTYEATLSQVYSLCDIDNSQSINSGLGPYYDILIRARIFWYAHVHEGITRGLNGERLVLDSDSLASFQSTLPPRYCVSATHSITFSPESLRSSPTTSSPSSPTFPFVTPLKPSHPRATSAYLVTTQYFSLALAVSQECRAIHSILTGPNARRRTQSGVTIRKEAIIEIWDELERCWENFESLRRSPSGIGSAGGDIIRGEDVEHFVSGWQLFIFGCLNVIRNALPNPTEKNHANADHAIIASLYLSALHRCQKFLPHVVQMLQRHLKVPSSFFAYDTGLIRDGCFFAGLLLAQSDKLDAEMDVMGWDANWEEGVVACLRALGEVRWVYSRSQEQEKALKAEWGARIERDTSRQRIQRSPSSLHVKQSPGLSPCLKDDTPLPCSSASTSPRTLSLIAAGGQVRPHLPALSVSFPNDDSGPDTALTDASSGWEPYTPPSTSGSITGTVVTHRSLSPISSPSHLITGLIPDIKSIKGPIFGDDSDNLFSYTVDGTLDSGVPAGWTPFSSEFLDLRVTSDTVLGCDDGFSSLASNCRPYLT